MISMKYIYTILILFVITSCSEQETKYNYFCGFAPSTPTDLIIKNDNSEKVKINLLVKESTLKRFGGVELDSNEEKQFCIDNEGEITNGLYFEFDGKQTKVILNSLAVNKFYVKSRMLINK